MRTAMRSPLPTIALLAALLIPGLAGAMDVVVGPTTLDPGLLAEELELPGTEEAAILVIAGLGLDRLEIGFDPVDLSALPGIERNPPLLVRGLPEGLVNLSLQRGDQAWDGQLRLFGGRVAKLDVDEVLRSARARGTATAPVAPSFDLFGFYDALDEEPDLTSKLAYCDGALGDLDEGSVDRRLVGQACDKVRADKERADADAAAGLLGADSLAEALRAEGRREAPVRVGLVYRKDGRPRLSAPGTGPRWAAVGAAGLLGGIFTYSAVFWETQAQQEYVQFRQAERVGDQLAMSRHLFFTKSFDQRRDGFAVAATTLFVSAASVAIWQAIEGARFRKARARVIGEEKTP
jgi:hypothetical protein